MNQEEVFDSLYTKSKEWEKEKEWRIVYNRLHEEEDLWKCVNGDIYFKAKVTGIILGYAVAYQNDSTQNLLRMIRNHNNQNLVDQIKVTKCLLNNGKRYGLLLDKQFDYSRKIL